jgi:hypothetical protein
MRVSNFRPQQCEDSYGLLLSSMNSLGYKIFPQEKAVCNLRMWTYYKSGCYRQTYVEREFIEESPN